MWAGLPWNGFILIVGTDGIFADFLTYYTIDM